LGGSPTFPCAKRWINKKLSGAIRRQLSFLYTSSVRFSLTEQVTRSIKTTLKKYSGIVIVAFGARETRIVAAGFGPSPILAFFFDWVTLGISSPSP
ncbi:MAG: hypothetical protein IJB85_01080, partial [Clostridia bacterium]|nr:hypothetical protein [Clostridia bacterium]